MNASVLFLICIACKDSSPAKQPSHIDVVRSTSGKFQIDELLRKHDEAVAAFYTLPRSTAPAKEPSHVDVVQSSFGKSRIDELLSEHEEAVASFYTRPHSHSRTQ